jgi:uncharacterized protein YecE (DUF72 family)
MLKHLLIGCSGYYYPQWKNTFYPAGLPSSHWLSYYSSVFNSVELNGTFYRIPKLSDLEKNAHLTPEGFKFTVKVNRYITHVMKLRDTSSSIMDFIHLIENGLAEKLDKFLFQLPPSFKYTTENLDLIVQNIPHSSKNVIEFRDASWWNPQVENAFKKHSLTFCNISHPSLPKSFIQTSNHFYLRLHGVPILFKSPYTNVQLNYYAQYIPSDCSSYNIYFNNTYYDAAYKNALDLMKILKPGIDNI